MAATLPIVIYLRKGGGEKSNSAPPPPHERLLSVYDGIAYTQACLMQQKSTFVFVAHSIS